MKLFRIELESRITKDKRHTFFAAQVGVAARRFVAEQNKDWRVISVREATDDECVAWNRLLEARAKRKYPSVDEVLDSDRTYKPAVLRAMKKYRDSKPWTGTLFERGEKLRKLHRSLCRIYDITPALVIDVPEQSLEHGNRHYDSRSNELLLTGKISVLTYLHEFAHAVFGIDEFKACGWSVNLYKRIFPVAWRKMKIQAIGL